MRDQRSESKNQTTGRQPASQSRGSAASQLAGAVGGACGTTGPSVGRAVEVKPTDPAPQGSTPNNNHRPSVRAARECGDCRVCCTLFEIPEVHKGLNEPCRHQGAKGEAGCKIYGHRPEVCRKFDCAWKQGLAGDHDRPDRLGVMLYTVTLEDGGHGLAIVESTPGAFKTRRVRDMIALYQSRKPGRIILRRAEDQRFKQASVLIEGKPLADAETVRVTTAETT
jgi:hypothetical protein